MSLKDQYKVTPTARETPALASTEFDGQYGHLQTRPMNNAPNDWADILREAGYDPEQVEVVGDPKVSRWEQSPGTWLSAYRLTLRRKGSGVSPYDLAEELRNAIPTPYSPNPAAPWFHVQFGDLHIGKSADAGGDSDEIIQGFIDSLDNARRELDRVGAVGGVCLSFLGDLIDGHTSQNGRLIAQQDLSLTEQIRVGRRLMLRAVDAFREIGVPVIVAAIGGNHDETTRVQNVKPGDNHAVEAAVALSDALALSPAYDHVTVQVPPATQGHMTIDVGGTRVCYVHGHKFGGGSVEKKITDWWSGQAIHGRPAGSAHVLCAGHFHSFRHFQVSVDKAAIMSPSLELESSWFAEMTGARSRRGCVSYLTCEGVVSRVSVL